MEVYTFMSYLLESGKNYISLFTSKDEAGRICNLIEGFLFGSAQDVRFDRVYSPKFGCVN